ncbi:MAG: hypothetical protein MR002_06420 [Acholeplasmatales bacterium]|nr:hypothetical protein [Acholeplasmatales bacterium]
MEIKSTNELNVYACSINISISNYVSIGRFSLPNWVIDVLEQQAPGMVWNC